MWTPFERLFGGDFMPHGHCYLWAPAMVWTQVGSNLAIGVSYVAIAVTLYLLVRRVRDSLPFGWIMAPFGVFILACGTTHFLDIATVWQPIYWVDAAVRVITAAASVGTALLLVRLTPAAIRLADEAQTTRRARTILERAAQREQGVDLEALANELTEQSKQMEQALVQMRAERDAALRENAALRSQAAS